MTIATWSGAPSTVTSATMGPSPSYKAVLPAPMPWQRNGVTGNPKKGMPIEIKKVGW
jgi:hypothetical protein